MNDSIRINVHHRTDRVSDDLVVIHDFLTPAEAADIHEELTAHIPLREWAWNIYPSAMNNSGIRYRYDDEVVNSERETARAAYKQGQFSYDYLTLDHPRGCSCLVCDLVRAFSSAAALKFVSGALGFPVHLRRTASCTWFAPGCYLAPHTDERNGDVAFVYTLTRDWEREFGGSLTILSRDRTVVRYTLIPRFNTLVLFRVSDSAHPHFVSEVTQASTSRRLAISGWYL